jgi:hypothetical protein
VRFTAWSSASTWAKSVFTVRSSVRFAVIPTFTSSPASPTPSDAALQRARPGSGVSGAAPARQQVRCRVGDPSPGEPFEHHVAGLRGLSNGFDQRGSMAGQEIISLFRPMLRQTVIPIVTRPVSSGWYGSEVNGMRISADQPVSVRVTSASQKAFHAKLNAPSASFGASRSVRTPAGVTPKISAFSRSRYPSMVTANQSLDELPSSRRSVVARMPSGSRSWSTPEM